MRVCNACGNEDIYFDAWVDQYGGVVSVFNNCFCPKCDGECTPVKAQEQEKEMSDG